MKKVFGIRHHGPGSAKNLKKALHKMQPDILLIEGPPDAEEQIIRAIDKDMKPPVALLVYSPDNFQHSAFYPFATFSPEWQAIQYGLKKEIPVRFMDLPQSFQWHLEAKEQLAQEKETPKVAEKDTKEETEPNENVEVAKKKPLDPMVYIAEVAGYNDGERWWEKIIEQRMDATDIFEGVLDLMAELREEYKAQESPRTLLREAYMRKIIRVAEKEGFERIAIVCGAWHAPTLKNTPPIKEDTALLKGLRKVKTQATWIAWTYERLSSYSGYGAGIKSPAWYELVFKEKKEDIVIKWMAKTAQLFRKEGQDGSPAHVIEATRLSHSLAHLRGREMPILSDFLEAVQSIFCFGDATPLKLIERELIVGNKIGKIPKNIPRLPLQESVEKARKLCLKNARYSENDKTDTIKTRSSEERLDINAQQVLYLTLDIREEGHRNRSYILHRLNLLNIDWANMGTANRKEGGSFQEHWALKKWMPELELNIIEAATYGNTLETASVNFIRKKLAEKISLSELARLLKKIFNANLPTVLLNVIAQLRSKAALEVDVLHFMDTLPDLISLMRYKDVRKTDTTQVMPVISAIIPRLLIGLPATCSNIKEDLVNSIFEKILKLNSSFQILKDERYQEDWYNTLEKIATSDLVAPKISAITAKILFEGGLWEIEAMEKNMSLALSTANKPSDTAAWIEGFLHGSGLLLIHNESLFGILDQWLANLQGDVFQELLPLLRRSFAHYSKPERQKIGKLAKDGPTAALQIVEETDLNMERVEQLFPILKEILA